MGRVGSYAVGVINTTQIVKTLEALEWASLVFDNLIHRRGCGLIECQDVKKSCDEAIKIFKGEPEND